MRILATVPTVLRVAVLVVVLLCASGVHCRTPDAGEYAVTRYLRQRDAWLKQRFPTNDSTLDADIAAFALPEHESTVREASVTECKRQFVITHERARAGELPLKFENYCEKPGKRSEVEPEAPTIFFIESDTGLQRATATIRAQANKGVCVCMYVDVDVDVDVYTHSHTHVEQEERARPDTSWPWRTEAAKRRWTCARAPMPWHRSFRPQESKWQPQRRSRPTGAQMSTLGRFLFYFYFIFNITIDTYVHTYI